MSLYGLGASLPPYSPATSQVYFPQFAAVGVAVGGTVQMGQAPGLYMSAGQALMAVASSQRLEGMYISLAHGMGCACQHCQFAGVAMGGAMGGAGAAGMGSASLSIAAVLNMPGLLQGSAAQAMGAQYGAAMAGGLSGGYSAAAAARIQEDPHGKSQSGQGSSNLANSPEVMLAMQEVLKGGGSKDFEAIKKELSEKFGIQAEVGDITIAGKDGKEDKTVKGLKFPNGDYFVDGNGNGQLDTGDYKFGDAVKALKEKYNLTDDNLKSVTDRMKATAEQRKQAPPGFGGPGFGGPGFGGPGFGGPGFGGPEGPFGVGGLAAQFPPGVPIPLEVALASMFGGGTPNLMHQPQANYGWMALFLQAFQMAAR